MHFLDSATMHYCLVMMKTLDMIAGLDGLIECGFCSWLLEKNLTHICGGTGVIVSQYVAEGLERARDGLTEAANLRERFVLGTSVSRRVAAAAASAAEAAAAAGESSFRSFMVAVQRSGSSVAIIQQYFTNSISRLLLPVDGAHAAACEEMATAMSSAEAAAYKGLQQCIETVMAEVERLLSAEQKATDYKSPDDGMAPDHRPTTACTRVVAYLSRVLESAFTALEANHANASSSRSKGSSSFDDRLSFKLAPQPNSQPREHTEYKEKTFSRPERIRSSSFSTDSVSPDVVKSVCMICEKPLRQKFNFMGNSLSCNELAVVAVLVCGHVYHADCLEQRTSLEELRDPSCPICTGLLLQDHECKEQE
ncbi:Exocyst complex component S10b [Lathyrus oleraceus]|uniref:Exocyst complex component S10b n=1 Tax=Pisum sativum TaxID=3888 RepID=A0A9D4X8L0_PEA|nr:Exocyst complex component S10b [Pisum sativum]